MNSLRKKGGIFINKKYIFLILTMILWSISSFSIAHAETASFYEAEYIDGIYMSKYQPSTRTTYYQKARFFRKSETNEFAYCIEPFQMFQKNNDYESVNTPYNLTEEQKEKIMKVARYGYGYQNHTDVKWYAITQFMIWQIADPSGDYFFTDYSNGNRIYPYNNEIEEINQLVNIPTTVPEELLKEYYVVENKPLLIEIQNNSLIGYQSLSEELSIGENTLLIAPLKKGEYEFTIQKTDNNMDTPLVFYQSNNSQNLMKMGYQEKIEVSLKVKSIPTKIEIYKIDQDTKSIEASGEASLNHAIIGLYNEEKEIIDDTEIIDNTAKWINLPFGTYYLKELEPGEGYTQNTTEYKIEISERNPIIQQVIENEAIKKRITIEKEYGTENDWEKEPNISFDIYQREKQVQTITTDNNGKAEITLPYGTYTIIQKNTTEGYEKADPIVIEITDEESEEFHLYDLLIPVPNTHTNILSWIISIIWTIFIL